MNPLEIYESNSKLLSTMSLTKNENDLSDISKVYWRFIYTSKGHSYVHDLVISNQLQHPKNEESTGDAFTVKDIKSIYDESNTTFSLPHGNISNPPIKKSLKPKAPSNVSYWDLNGIFFTKFELFKHMLKFKKITMLSLRNCGLMTIPPELTKLPPGLRELDLSLNFLKTIPPDVKWEQLVGLNLSQNAFKSWPEAIQGPNFPNLQYLSLMFNHIGSKMGQNDKNLSELTDLNLSFCALTDFPAFVFQCPKLQSLNISGNGQMKPLDLETLSSLPSLQFIYINGLKVTSEIKDSHIPKQARLLSRDVKVQCN